MIPGADTFFGNEASSWADRKRGLHRIWPEGVTLGWVAGSQGACVLRRRGRGGASPRPPPGLCVHTPNFPRGQGEATCSLSAAGTLPSWSALTDVPPPTQSPHRLPSLRAPFNQPGRVLYAQSCRHPGPRPDGFYGQMRRHQAGGRVPTLGKSP